jgi:malonyl-CoA O-methyltransferase
MFRREGHPVSASKHVDWVDRDALMRTFDRAARQRGESFIAREIERRMAERLDYIKHAPARILDAGCGGGEGAAMLRARYPRADLIGVDASAGALARARGARSVGERLRAMVGGTQAHYVRADLSAAAIRPGACDMLWSNLALAWSADVPAAIRGWGTAVAPGGLVMFSTFGPDTLRELAAAFAGCDDAPHVHPFTDMHDIGDMLIEAGFGEPVIDMEVITLTYASPDALIAELRGAGYGNVRTDRRRTLMGRERWAAMLTAYAGRARDGRVPATFEVVYGHAWKAAPRTAADGRAIVRFDKLPLRPKNA